MAEGGAKDFLVSGTSGTGLGALALFALDSWMDGTDPFKHNLALGVAFFVSSLGGRYSTRVRHWFERRWNRWALRRQIKELRKALQEQMEARDAAASVESRRRFEETITHTEQLLAHALTNDVSHATADEIPAPRALPNGTPGPKPGASN